MAYICQRAIFLSSFMQKLFVGGLTKETDEIELAKLFSFFSNINTIMIMHDHGTGASKGFAFVEMHNMADAAEAIAQLNGANVNGVRIKVALANAKTEASSQPDNKALVYKKVERVNVPSRGKRPRIQKG